MTEPQEPPQDDKSSIHSIQNFTRHRLRIIFQKDGTGDQIIQINPLEQIFLELNSFQQRVFRELTHRRILLCEPSNQFQKSGGLSGESYFWLFSIFAYVVYIIGQVASESAGVSPLIFWIGLPAIALGVILFLIIRGSKYSRMFFQSIGHSFTLLMVFFIALGATALGSYYYLGGRELLAATPTPAHMARILQFILIATGAMFPSLLFYLFDRNRLGTLRDRFIWQIFRLDPSVKSLPEIQEKYGSQLEDIYGDTRAGRLMRGSRMPILLATLLIAAGWMLLFLSAEVPADSSGAGLLALFLPQATPLTFGFLGTYYFAIEMLLRRYNRGDLTPKAYSHIAVRLIKVIIWAWVLEVFFGASPTTLALAFFSGFVPEQVLVGGNEIFSRILLRFQDEIEEKHPLTRLEGIDLYERARLYEEGITNIEALAHCDIIHLVLATRIPVPRLVDWVDQSILYLHIQHGCPEPDRVANSQENAGKDDSETTPNEVKSLRCLLESYGVRTASDFVRFVGTGGLDLIPVQFQSQLNQIHIAINDDEWMHNINNWRTQPDSEQSIIKVSESGEITEDVFQFKIRI